MYYDLYMVLYMYYICIDSGYVRTTTPQVMLGYGSSFYYKAGLWLIWLMLQIIYIIHT